MLASAPYVFFQYCILLCILHVLTVHCQNRVWTRLAGTSTTDNGRGVATDAITGELYVAGSATASLHGETFAGSTDILLIKYSSSGTRIWTRMVGTSGLDVAFAVCVDSTREAVYITGYASGSLHGQPYASNTDVVSIKYSTNGTRIWTRMSGSLNIVGGGSFGTNGLGVTVDPSTGDVFISGSTLEDLDDVPAIDGTDVFLSKYISNGTRIWTKIMGDSGADFGYAIAFDSLLNALYVTGFTTTSINGEVNSNGFLDIFLARFSLDGTPVWTKLVGSSTSSQGRAVAVDPKTSAVYVTGQTRGSVNGQPYNALNDIVTLKYLPNGTSIWTRSAGSGGDDFGFGAVVDGYGSVVIVGRAAGSLNGQTYLGGATDAFLIKYAGNGTMIWTRMLGTSGNDTAAAVALSRINTEYYVTGAVGASMDGESFAGGVDVFLTSVSNGQGTVEPTGQPSGQPSRQPSVQPSAQPSSVPSSQPSAQPSGRPSRQPSRQPSAQPFSMPSSQPSNQPTRQPTGQPTSEPTDGAFDMLCQHRTFRQVSSQAEFTSHRCFSVPHSQGGNRRLLTKSNHHSTPPHPRSDFLCSEFASNQDVDFKCEFLACPGDYVQVSMQPSEGGVCTGDFEVQLRTESARIVAASDSALGECPALLHSFKDIADCATYTVLHRCLGPSPCTGRTAVKYLYAQ